MKTKTLKGRKKNNNQAQKSIINKTEVQNEVRK